MLTIAIVLLFAVIATVVGCIAASPLFRTMTLAIDSWAEAAQGLPERQR